MSKKNRKNLHKESNKIWIIITLIFTFSYMLWRMFFTMPVNKVISSIIFWALLLIVELFGLVEMVVHFYNMYDYGGYHVQKKKMKRQEFPHVDVFIPSLDEPGELLEKTIAACKAMEYPDNRKIHIYLCDDGEREEMAALAKRMKVNYLARTEHSDAKAGNLNFRHQIKTNHAQHHTARKAQQQADRSVRVLLKHGSHQAAKAGSDNARNGRCHDQCCNNARTITPFLKKERKKLLSSRIIYFFAETG